MYNQTRDSSGLSLAMAYMPMQRLDTVYSPSDALVNGTLFPALCKPFLAYREGGAHHG